MVAPIIPQNATPQSLAQLAPSQADMERKRQITHAWKAYRGEFSAPLVVKAGQPNDNVISNRCAPIVDKGVSFLFGQVLKLEAENQDDQDCLDGLWGDDDERMTCLSNQATNGGVCGHNFVKLIPPQGDSDYPRLVVLDPQLIRVVTAPDDCTLVLAYIIEYPAANGWQKKQVISRVDLSSMLDGFETPELNSTWTIANYVRRGDASGNNQMWEQSGDVVDWPYPFPPIFSNQNLPNPNEFWGTPDLTPDLIDQNRVLNFLQSNLSRIIKFHGHPKTFVTGSHAEQIKVGVDDVIVFQAPDAKIEALSPMENFSGILSFVEDIRSNMDEQSRVPAVALGRLAELPKGNISGVALQLLFQPLIEKTVQKQRLYGELIRAVSRAALVLAGKLSVEAYEDYQIELHWQNLLPVDDLAAAQTALILKQLGVSDATIMQQLGYDPDVEVEKSVKEDAKKLQLYSKGQGMPMVPPGSAVPQGQQQQQQAQPPAANQPQGGQNAAE